jgi:hypothetical protein
MTPGATFVIAVLLTALVLAIAALVSVITIKEAKRDLQEFESKQQRNPSAILKGLTEPQIE